MSNTTKEKAREYNRRYYLKNKDKLNSQKKEWWSKNKDRVMQERYHEPKYKYRSYKKWAEYRGLDFELTLEEFTKIITESCLYCGDKDEPFNGIDRYDNNIGYVMNNSVACCKMCNHMKYTYTASDFVIQCKKIARHL